jgi:hypothetical protein
MSVTPEQETHSPPAQKRAWLLPVCFAVFAFEIGAFLLVFPWMDSWNTSYFEVWSPAVQNFWNDAHFRGALSGLGVVNIYIGFQELMRLVRRALAYRRPPPP